MNSPDATSPVWVSIGIIARNEAEIIGSMLESLFQQTLFAELALRGQRAEVHCLANACDDETPRIAAEVFARQDADHPYRTAFTCHLRDLKERGKLPAWNSFVHQFSARSARYLVLMDGDILLDHPATLWNLCATLEEHPEACIAVDEPVKDIALKPRPTLGERLSLATSRLTQGAEAQLTGQLYCIRAEIARNIHLPRGLPACEDGFIKGVVCTDFVTRAVQAERIVRAPAASHIFEAYRSLPDVLKNQKRQMMGQAYVHLLVDKCLPKLTLEGRVELGRTLAGLDAGFPCWLQRLMAEHLSAVRYWWRLFPGVLSLRWRRLARMRGANRIAHLPAAFVGWVVALVACWLAWRALWRGSEYYWPDTRSRRLRHYHRLEARGGAVNLSKPATPQ